MCCYVNTSSLPSELNAVCDEHLREADAGDYGEERDELHHAKSGP